MRIPMALPAPFLVLVLVVAGWLAGGWPNTAQADDGALCRAAIGRTEAARHIPDAFLSAIARVESGRPDQAGTRAAWPWTINAEGIGSFFATRSEAVAAVRALQARGVRSIDVGCLQVNLLNHPEAFASLEQAFDPAANADYAATFLLSLFARTRSWPLAAAAYHSQTPTIGAAYQRRVLAEWAVPDDDAAQPAPKRAIAAAPAYAWHHETGRDAPAGAATMASSMPQFAKPAATQSGPAVGHMASFTRAAPPGGIAFSGRSLAAYRMMPTALAFRLPAKPG